MPVSHRASQVLLPAMLERFAIYFAPERGSLLEQRAEAWLAQPKLLSRTVSARRYGFHATLKAPMRLCRPLEELEASLQHFAAQHRRVALDGLAPWLIEGFVALTCEPQTQTLTDFA